MEQDVAFGVRQLVDAALRGLSPAVNDPYTAVQAIQHLSVVLRTLADRVLTNETHFDERGIVRVAIPRPDFAMYLRLTCDQIRRNGAREPAVARGLLRLLTDVGHLVTTDERRRAIEAEARMVLADAERQTFHESELEIVRREAELVFAATGQTRR